MAMIPCPENECSANVSIKANSCPACGYPVQKFLEEELGDTVIGVPVGPLRYWIDWHIYYWRGLQKLKINFPDIGWAYQGDIIMSIPGIEIQAPVSGLLLGVQSIAEKNTATQLEVSSKYSTDSYVAIRLREGTKIPEFDNIYTPLHEFLMRQVEHQSRRRGILKLFLEDRTHSVGLDPKERFTTHDEMVEKIEDLMNIKPLILSV